ncbi:MAG: 4Fe-4S dicluster domain-containing protein [Rhodobacteraceae bacterium]|nr:4Fe-4S dicluster domain-containing protein [Paracoccaceae bacterium]
MTSLPQSTEKKLGLVIDLDVCVGCHACVINCKAWNTNGYGSPLADTAPYDDDPSGVWLNRIHSYETDKEGYAAVTHFPKSCLHCDDAPCVTVCPTGASYKRVADGIVLVEESQCMGCGLCAWACPYGAREMDPLEGVMKKCTLCVDRIYNENIPEEDRQPACVRTCPAKARFFGDFSDPHSEVSQLVNERNGVDLMPEQETKPVNKYLLPEQRFGIEDLGDPDFNLASFAQTKSGGILSWIDDLLQR